MTLAWQTSAGATTYTLQVSRDSLFSSFDYNQSGISGTSLQITGLNNGITYYWRVSATNNYLTSPYSIPWSFTTSTSGTIGSPCPGTPTVIYAGKTYNTVQIGSQCWFKENLNIGIMIDSLIDASNNGIIEKYCYNNITDNCTKYGGLYQWAEAVQYKNSATNLTNANPPLSGSIQGICPIGWHIPGKTEFAALATSVNDSSKALLLICESAGTNTSGFSALLAGGRNGSFGFVGSLGGYASFWSSA